MAAGGLHFLELSKNVIQFDSVRRTNSVFFDESNKQVFCIQTVQNKMQVVAKAPTETNSTSFVLESRGDVNSIKFSRDYKILAVQRSQKSVEFMNLHPGGNAVEYSQSCKGKTTRILGFCWIDSTDIVFITDHGLEYYQVISDKRTLKMIKAHAVNVNWFVWLPSHCLLLLSSGALGNTIYPFSFRQGALLKLPKFEIELLVTPKPPKLCLLERDVNIGLIYGQLYVIVVRHLSLKDGNPGAEILLYLLQKEIPARKTDILKLNISGRFAINIIDSLVVVHHQALKSSFLFDIRLGGVNQNGINYHETIVPPLPISSSAVKAFNVNESNACEMYSPHWIVFQPNIIIDAKLGFVWFVQLLLDPLLEMVTDKCKLMDLLLLRKECKFSVLNVCKQLLSPATQSDLMTISKVFDKLNVVYSSYLQTEAQLLVSDSPSGKRSPSTVIDESDMYTHIFSLFVENKDISYKFIVAVLVEYIRSLTQYEIVVQHYLYELMITTLVHNNCFYQLHQFLQYHVLSDSKPLACLLLSLESTYPPAYQLALDMLKRLSTANEEIIEVLLSKHQLLAALRFIRSIGAVDTVSARKFLDAARNTNDNMMFYTVFKFFEQRNIRLRNDPSFPKGEHCEKFVKHMEGLYGSDSFSKHPAN